MQRVVLTGLGAVTPVGNTADEFWSALLQGRSGVGPITKFDATDYPTRIAGEVKNFERGEADVMIAGGSEAIVVPLTIAGFCSMKAMSTRNDEPAKAMRPFDADRDGFVCGEGAGLVVLESLDHALRRDARIYAEIVGYGMTGDAHHMTAPDPEGDGAARAMTAALRDGGVDVSAVRDINAHGTPPPYNNRFETPAIKRGFGGHAGRLAVSSTKSMTGPLPGAARAPRS